MPNVYQIDLPNELRNLLDSFDLFFNINLITFVPLPCLGLRGFRQELVFTAIVPLVLYAAIISLSLLRSFLRVVSLFPTRARAKRKMATHLSSATLGSRRERQVRISLKERSGLRNSTSHGESSSVAFQL